MKTKATQEIRTFKFRVIPHEIMKEEYPAPYYKFRNKKIANAFFHESCGNELNKKGIHV